MTGTQTLITAGGGASCRAAKDNGSVGKGVVYGIKVKDIGGNIVVGGKNVYDIKETVQVSAIISLSGNAGELASVVNVQMVTGLKYRKIHGKIPSSKTRKLIVVAIFYIFRSVSGVNVGSFVSRAVFRFAMILHDPVFSSVSRTEGPVFLLK